MPGGWSRARIVQCRLRVSNVDALLGVPLQIPAGSVSGVGKQRVDAGSRLWWLEDELGLATFLQDRIVGHHGELSVGLAVRRDAMAEHNVIDGVGEAYHAQHGGDPNGNDSLQKMLDPGSEG